MALKLYGHDTSPYVRRIRVLLAEKGLPFSRDEDSWSTPNAEITRINPMLRVPALLDEEAGKKGQLLLDSKLIATYLYDRHPNQGITPGGLLPLQATLFHSAHRYDDENALLGLDAALDSAINVFLLELDGVPREKSPYLTRQFERIRRCLSFLDEQVGDKTTFHEGSFAFIDIAIVCALDWMNFRNRYPVAEHSNLSRLIAAHAARPSLSATHPSLAKNQAPPKTRPA